MQYAYCNEKQQINSKMTANIRISLVNKQGKRAFILFCFIYSYIKILINYNYWNNRAKINTTVVLIYSI
jgi:hypothetical protein